MNPETFLVLAFLAVLYIAIPWSDWRRFKKMNDYEWTEEEDRNGAIAYEGYHRWEPDAGSYQELHWEIKRKWVESAKWVLERRDASTEE